MNTNILITHCKKKNITRNFFHLFHVFITLPFLHSPKDNYYSEFYVYHFLVFFKFFHQMYVCLNNALFIFASLHKCNHKVTWILLLTIPFVRWSHIDVFVVINLFSLLCNISLDDSISITLLLLDIGAISGFLVLFWIYKYLLLYDLAVLNVYTMFR